MAGSRTYIRTRSRGSACRAMGLVSVLLPECRHLPEKLKQIIDGMGTYYLVKNLPLHEFLNQEFNDGFIKKGLFYALSYNTRIDQDNVAAVLPTGKLIISVNKDTYEELGLQGKSSLYSGKHVMRYIITIDLTDSAMSPDGKKFQRVRWALTEKKPLSFDFLVARDNSEEPSISSYFSKYIVKEYPYKITSSVSRDLPCPVLKSDELHGKGGVSCGAPEVFEWLGAISNNIDWITIIFASIISAGKVPDLKKNLYYKSCNNESSSFISSFCCPEPNSLVGQAHLCTITGFITPVTIQQLMNQLREYFHEPKLSQWVSLMVHGFADSPVSWRESEHGYFKGEPPELVLMKMRRPSGISILAEEYATCGFSLGFWVQSFTFLILFLQINLSLGYTTGP
ncbi:ribonuclease P protein subunit p40 isoform 2-T2 [Anomaloglossus baeobatrachus]|uniref:ribonuclease P protein subunit p40 isoform X2 n=1 Tax=Anomaloglossus baeobatrachus TaxID=238106 RepID=UPI003F4F85F7